MSTPGRRSGLSCIVVLLLIAALLAVAAFVADRVLRDRVESQIETKLATVVSAEGLSATVTDRFVPWSLVRNRLDSGYVTAQRATITRDGRSITFDDLRVDFAGVTNARHPAEAVIADVSGSGLIDWTELSNQLGIDLSYAGENRLGFTASADLYGQQVSFTVSGVPAVDAAGAITISDAKADVNGVALPANIVQAVLSRLANQLRLPTLPDFGYSSIEVLENGVVIAVQGSDVEVSQLR